MRDGLEEFLKRIEEKPTNETLIDRFMTLMMEEDSFNRIFYLKKLVALLLNSNPYYALKAAALELQEARKDGSNKDYELGALKDVEASFLKLGKMDNANFISEEIKKLLVDIEKSRTTSMPKKTEIRLPNRPNSTQAFRPLEIPQATAPVPQVILRSDDDEEGKDELSKSAFYVPEVPGASEYPRSNDKNWTGGEDTQSFEAALFYDPQHSGDRNPKSEKPRPLENPQPQGINTVSQHRPSPPEEALLDALDQPEPMPSPVEFNDHERTQVLGRSSSTSVSESPEAEATVHLDSHEAPSGMREPIAETWELGEAEAEGKEEKDEIELSLRLKEAKAPLPVKSKTRAKTENDEMARRMTEAREAAFAPADSLDRSTLPEAKKIFSAPASHPEGGLRVLPQAEPAKDMPELMLPIPSEPRSFSSDHDESLLTVVPIRKPAQAVSWALNHDDTASLFSGEEDRVHDERLLRTSPPHSAQEVPELTLRLGRDQGLRWDLLRDRLLPLAGFERDKAMITEFLKKVCGKNATPAEVQAAKVIVLEFLAASEQVEVRWRFLEWIFVVLESGSMHQLWLNLQLHKEGAHFFGVFLRRKTEQFESRRALSLIRSALIAELDIGWFQESYAVLQKLWDRLYLVPWVWSPDEGQQVFCERLARREGLLPCAILGKVR